MRLGVVTTSYPRYPGEPAGCFVSELNDWLRAQGHSLEVLAAGPGSEESWQASPVTRLPSPAGLFYQGGAPDALSLFSSVGAGLFSARQMWAVRRRASRYQGIIAHWLAPSALACALAAPRLPIWAIAHGGDVHLLARLGLAPLAARILDRPGLELRFVSRAVRERFAEAAGPAGRSLVARSQICPMGIELARLRALSPTRQSGDKPLLLFLGRLVPIKGVDILLDALACVDRSCEVIIAGAGPERGRLETQAAGLGGHIDLHFAGEVRGSARDALLARADVVVLPSRRYRGREEGMPRVALEALAAGAQLLVARSGGLAEIPESVCHGVESENAPALGRAIVALLGGRRAPYAPGHWLEEHGWEAIGPRLLSGLTAA